MTDVTLWLAKQTANDTDMVDDLPVAPVFEAEVLRSRVSVGSLSFARISLIVLKASNARCLFEMKDGVLCSGTQGPGPETVDT